MTAKRLSIVKTKIDRSKAQIDQLNKDITVWLSRGRYQITSELNYDNTEEIWNCAVRDDLLAEISVRAGEIGHNLRTSLDNLACAIADQHCGRTNRTYFPFGRTAEIFEAEVLKKTKDLPSDAVDLIRSLEPYAGGDDLLWGIHDMNREDKHPGIEAIAAFNTGMNMYELKLYQGKLLIMGPRFGQHLVAEGYTPKFCAGAVYKNGEFLTTTPDSKFEVKASFPFHIAFRDLTEFKHKPLIVVLTEMRDLVESIFLTFEEKFF